ncbi:hypothetical protein M0R45_011331 [Rubus argutus]|uniref:RPW8 domain-containing protein n=1 Tax=Rubus argutus TaxID=59490 RepID=A0AAW1YBB4_RUBAR
MFGQVGQEEVFSWHLMDMFKWSDRGFRILPSQIEEAHPIDDDDDDALQYAYWILFRQDKPPRSNDEDHSKEELEKFRVEMEKGAEMVPKCCKVGEWASYNTKFKYINQLLGLNQSLRRWVDGRTALEEFLERVSRDLREAWAKMRNRDAKLDEMKGILQCRMKLKIKIHYHRGTSWGCDQDIVFYDRYSERFYDSSTIIVFKLQFGVVHPLLEWIPFPDSEETESAVIP